MPNTFAHLVLYGWPLVVVALFVVLPRTWALAGSIVGGYLLLPTQLFYDLPLLPPFDKTLIPSLAAAICAVVSTNAAANRRGPQTARMEETLPGWLPRTPLGFGLVIALLAGTFMTVLTNGDTLVYGPMVLPGLRLYDAFSMSLELIVSILPFLLARKYLAHTDAHRTILVVICVAALLYSLPTLYEIRMSPQLNRMFYGFFPHSWLQHLREEGYRPIVFMGHGLQLSIFLVVGLLATIGVMRLWPRAKLPLGLGAVWLFGTLFLTKSLGAFLIAVVALPVALLARTRMQLLVAGVVAATVLTYPVLRGNGLVPVDRLVRFAESIDDSRARSLQFRLNNEDILLEKANERPLFGWGKWSRNRVFNEEGRDISTTDGAWIIAFSQGGWVFYLGQFGLLCGPIILLAFRQKRYQPTLATSALAFALTANLVDLVPNAGLSPVVWLMAGALVGRLEVTTAPSPQPDEEAAVQPGRWLPYRREFPKGQRPARPLRPPARSAATQPAQRTRHRPR